MNHLQDEANRCLQCKNPRCVKGCPINTPIPEIIQYYKEGQFEKAGEILFENNPLSAVCSIVCAHENQCSGNCIRGVKGEPIEFYLIERFLSMHFLDSNVKVFRPKGKIDERIAIVGSGPAGLTIAFILAEKGYKVTIFESKEKIGGVLRYGIPEFRLPRIILDKLQQKLIQLGVRFRPNTLIGPVLTIDKLFLDGYKAVFLGTGVWNPKTLSIKGESLGNAIFAIDYLKSPSVYYIGKKVAVIGAGNVAMDAARTALRNGANEVIIFYRKGFDTMSATKKEISEAIEDGVQFSLYKAPVEILDEGLKYVETETVVDESTDTNTEKGRQDIYCCDSVIIAISQSPRNNIVSNTKGINTDTHGLLVADETGHTTREGVFASGDVVTGARTVVEAVNYAKIVARSMDEYCESIRN